jgi:hypothetical protein
MQGDPAGCIQLAAVDQHLFHFCWRRINHPMGDIGVERENPDE